MLTAIQARAGDPARADAVEKQILLAQPVAFEGTPRPMRFEGVEFDDEALLGPVDVELVTQLVVAAGRFRQTGLLGQVEEATLQAGAGERRRPVELEGLAQAAVAGVADGAREQLVDLAQVEQLQLFGPLDALVEARPRDPGGKVEQGAGEGGDGDVLLQGAVRVPEIPGVMQPDRWSRPAPRRRKDLEGGRALPREAPEPSGGAVAEERPGAGGQDGGQAAPLWGG